MNISFVVPRFYPYRGGYENSILWIARGLHQAGNNVTVITTTAYDLESFWLRGFRTLPEGPELVDGVKVYRLPICYNRWLRRLQRLLSFLPDWRLKAMFARPSFPVVGLSEALHREKPDVVHVGPLPYNRMIYEGLHAARRLGARVIATPCTHLGEDGRSEISGFYTQRFQITMLLKCDAVLTMTQAERERLSALGIPADRLCTANYAIDPDRVTKGNAARFRAKHGIAEPIVLHVGTKAYDKGSNSVVEAMKILWDAGTRAWLVIAGSTTSDFDRFLEKQGPNLNRVLNLDQIGDEEKRDLLAAADVLVNPSRVESLGLVYLEAWANGKPVIAADMAVTREIIDHQKDGLLVPFGDSVALSRSIGRLLDNAAERERMGQRGRKKVDLRFCWKVAAPKIYSVFNPTL